ncbi:beta-N-acetylhexosaminidase [Catalinimonas alkaloidigena]|uniref:beta-N-acetylhexosaminidase n=1 Tax=Catalinimonas alkaloidigena TaxID=1075417 RepID=UPI002405D93A|nr:family 20 glycosylhydrolase [Catalinimonas alkaloidigena]
MQLIKIFFTSIVFLVSLGVVQASEIDTLHLIPQPRSVMMKEGVFKLSESTEVYVPRKVSHDFEPYLSVEFTEAIGLEPAIKKGVSKRTSDYIQFTLDDESALDKDGYTLEVSPSRIEIKAAHYGGLFNGFQTLKQLLPRTSDKVIEIPSLLIEDAPRFEWRGVMLDVARHFQPKEFILKQIDVLSSYKINKFHWHLTDDQGWRVEIKKYPRLVKKGAWRADRKDVPWWKRQAATAEEPKTVGGYYTQEDIKEVIAYAKIRNVEIIPEIDVPGHSKALVASYPHLFCYDDPDANFEVAVGGKAPDNAVCAGKESTYEFLAGVIEEVAALFPSEYLHIGGDECNKTNWKKCPYCQKVKSEYKLQDEEELQSHFIQRIHKLVKAQHKTMIGWDEILSGKGAKGATIMAWRRGKFTPEITAPREGYPTIMSSYQHSYISQVQGPIGMEPEGPKVVLPLSKVYSHEPVPEELSDEEASSILGNEACLWGEFTPTQEHCEYMLYPRAIASAEVSWSLPEQKSWQRFQHAIESHFERLDRADVNYAKSIYTVYPSFALNPLKEEAQVYLYTEAEGYPIYYSIDGSEPQPTSSKYEGNFKAAAGTLVKAGLFDKNGKLLGKVSEFRLR